VSSFPFLRWWERQCITSMLTVVLQIRDQSFFEAEVGGEIEGD